jgi:hypothetical protein
MKILKKIKYKLFGGSFADKYPDLQLVSVDICGRKFWKFADDTQMPTFRACAYMNMSEMFDNRICHKDITFFCEQIENQLNRFLDAQKDGNTLKGLVTTINTINSYIVALKRKNELAFSTDMIYNLASVVFMSEEENPYEYNPDLQGEKIEFWKSKADFFFCEKPVKELLPAYITSHTHYQTFIQELLKEEKKITDFLTQITS